MGRNKYDAPDNVLRLAKAIIDTKNPKAGLRYVLCDEGKAIFTDTRVMVVVDDYFDTQEVGYFDHTMPLDGELYGLSSKPLIATQKIDLTTPIQWRRILPNAEKDMVTFGKKEAPIMLEIAMKHGVIFNFMSAALSKKYRAIEEYASLDRASVRKGSPETRPVLFCGTISSGRKTHDVAVVAMPLIP